MNRREFAGLGIGSMALAGLGTSVFAQEKDKAKSGADHQEGTTSEALMRCAEECSKCQRECDSCGSHCAKLLSEGKKEHLNTLMTCRDCADFCSAAAEIVARGGPFASLICESCAEACARCGQECEKFPESEQMKRCAQACRSCEKACREMAKHRGHA